MKAWLTRGRREDSGDYAEFAQAVEEARAVAAVRPEAMDDEELARVVSQMPRACSVQAAKLRWEMLQAERELDAPAEIDEFDPMKAGRAGVKRESVLLDRAGKGEERIRDADGDSSDKGQEQQGQND